MRAAGSRETDCARLFSWKPPPASILAAVLKRSGRRIALWSSGYFPDQGIRERRPETMKTIGKLGIMLCLGAAFSYAESWTGKVLDASCYDAQKTTTKSP